MAKNFFTPISNIRYLSGTFPYTPSVYAAPFVAKKREKETRASERERERRELENEKTSSTKGLEEE